MNKSCALAMAAALTLAGCATADTASNGSGAGSLIAMGAAPTAMAQADQPRPPGAKPIEGNGGLYMSPFTSDGVTAEWVTKSMKVKAGGQIAGAAGQIAGQQLMNNIPFIGGFLGQKAGKALGRAAAMNAIGGAAFVKSSSDLSFNSLQDMASNLYAEHSDHPDYAAVLQATYAIYPELEGIYLSKYPKPRAATKLAKSTS